MKSRDLFRILWTVLYFTDQFILEFHKLFCKITYLRDIDLKFSGSIFKVIIDNTANFVKLAGLKVAFRTIGIFGILVGTRQVVLILF